VRQYLERELCMSLPQDDFSAHVMRAIDVMVELELLKRDEHNGRLRRPESRSFAAVQLSLLAQNILPALERYYLVIALLLKHGSGVIRQSDLERECQLMAERVSLLHELDAPEFFDRSLFRAFIDQLREAGVLWTDSLQRLTFDARVREVGRDAQIVLSEQIRHSILQVTHA
jgi:glycerol-3-phosphate O-acyltransferase